MYIFDINILITILSKKKIHIYITFFLPSLKRTHNLILLLPTYIERN